MLPVDPDAGGREASAVGDDPGELAFDAGAPVAITETFEDQLAGTVMGS